MIFRLAYDFKKPFFSGMAKPTCRSRNGDTQPFLGVNTPYLQPSSGWLLSAVDSIFKEQIKALLLEICNNVKDLSPPFLTSSRQAEERRNGKYSINNKSPDAYTLHVAECRKGYHN